MALEIQNMSIAGQAEKMRGEDVVTPSRPDDTKHTNGGRVCVIKREEKGDIFRDDLHPKNRPSFVFLPIYQSHSIGFCGFSE